MNPWENDPEAVTATQPWEADPEAVAGPWENDPPTDAAELETFRRDNRLADASTIAIQDPRALTPGLQLAQEPLPALQQPDIQTPPANINAANAAGMVADLYRLERDAQQAEGAGIQPANEAANMQRRNLQMAGLAPEDINRRLEDFKALDFSASTRGMPRARTLSDGRLVVDPALAFDPAAWNAAVDGSSASDVEKENAKYYRTQLREELAQQIVSPLRSASPEFAAALESGRATRTVGELVEDFKRTNSGTFSNLWDQFGIALSQGKAQLGKSLMGAARMATFDMLPGNLGEGFADDAQWHAQRRAALGGGQWAGDLTATVVGTLPTVGVGMGTSSFPAMLATGGGQAAGDTFVAARQAGWSPLEAAGAALVQGGVEVGVTAAFGKTGIESVAAGASEKGLLRRVITGGAWEVPEEVSITALQAPMNEAIQPGSSADLPQQLIDTAWQSFAIGGGVAALHGKAPEKPEQPASQADTTAQAPAQEVPNFDDLAADLKAIANEDSDEPTGTAPLPKEPTTWKPAPEAPPLPPAPVTPDENFARATSFPRGLLPFVTPEEAGAVMAEKEGQMQLVAVQALMNRARTRQAEAATAQAKGETADEAIGGPYKENRVGTGFFSDKSKFYRVVVGDEAFADIVETGQIRTNAKSKTAAGSSLADKLTARPTAFPSFSAGAASMSYAAANPNHYIIVSSDPSIQPSKQGRHGKGTTMFPYGTDGNPVSSISAKTAQVYKHEGDGNYSLVYDGTRLNPPATPDAPLPPAPAGPAPIGPDVQAQIAADPEVQTDVTTESASPQPATPFAERQQDPVAEGALHVRETELLRRLESKRRETRENAEAELMARKGLPWTNRPEQAEITARETAELRARVQEREARWNNEADQLAEEAGIEITADNIPFSQQKINPEPIAQAVRETMEMLGVGPDVVTAEVVDDVESIEDINARRAATASKKAGNNIRAYYLAGKAGKPSRVVINAAGVRTPEAARIATLHEVAGHHGLRVLFTKAQGKWRGIVDRLYRRLSNGELSQEVQRETGVRTLRELQELYHRPDAGMNYDPATEEGRSNLIEEVLATMAPFAKKPAWYQSILSELKTLLNRVTGGLLGRSFTDADVNVLLAKARRAAKRGDGKAAAVKQSLTTRPSTEESSAVRDAEYLDAVRRVDMATAQRLVDEAAKAAGFDLRKVTHITPNEFTKFDLSKFSSGEVEGFYFAGEAAGDTWKMFTGGKRMIRAYLRMKNPVRMDVGKLKGSPAKNRTELQSLGYDAVVDDSYKGDQFIVFDPNQIKSADPVTRDDAGNVIPLSQRFNEASPDIRFSQESAEREARSVQRALEASARDLKEYATQKKAKADPNVPDAVKQMLNGVYATYSDAQALRDAQAWLDKDGADEVERTLMGGQRAQLDGRDVAAAKLIASRLSTLGLHQRYTDFMRAVFTKMNTQAQGLQKMHLLFDTTTPEGALAYFQKEVENAISQLSDKNKEQARIIQGLLGMLEQFKADAATSRIVMALRTIATSADLTEARKAEVSEKMRAALVNDDGTDTTRVRLRGLFIAAGVEVKAADKMAVQLLTKFRAAQKKARAQVIKQLLKVPKIVKRIPKGMFAKWEKLNDEGALSDAKLFGAIANRFGFPVFTSEDAATIRGFFDRYKAATEPELKFVQAAKLLEWIEERTNPAGIMEKAGAIYKLTKLASFKTIERNFLGNLTFAIARTAGIDVPMWIGEKGISLFTGKRVSPLRTALGNMFRGQAEVNRIYRIGRDYAVSQGEGRMKSVRAGFDTLLTAARYHMAGYRDAAGLKNIHRSVFSSAAGKMFEKVMHAAITLPDLGRFYGEVNAELARLMDAAGPGTVLPTAEMFEAAYLHAQRELYQGKNRLTDAVETIVKGANKLTGSEKFGLGTVIAPFVRVPVNILKEGATWSPLGVVRALYNAGIDKDPRRAVQSAMKAVVGTGALIPAGAWLYGLGIITAALDEDDEIAAVQRASGMQKYAINLSMLNRRRLSGNWLTKEEAQEGDVIVSYAWAQPMAFSLAAGAEMQRRHDKAATTDEPWWSRRIVEPAGSGFGAFMEQPLVTGVSAFSNDLMQARQTGNYRTLWRLPIRALDFVPAIVRDVRYFNNNALPETRSSDVIGGEFSRILGGVPSIDLPQRYNVLGEAEERYQAASNTILNTFFNPAMTTFVRKHPVASEVLRLAEQTGDKSVAPARVNKSVRINTTGMPNAAQTLALTNQDVSRLQELQGKLFVELAKLEMTRPDYFRMTDYQRAKSMADAVAASQSAAKSVLFGHRLYSISPEGPTLNRDAVRAVLIGKAAGIIP